MGKCISTHLTYTRIPNYTFYLCGVFITPKLFKVELFAFLKLTWQSVCISLSKESEKQEKIIFRFFLLLLPLFSLFVFLFLFLFLFLLLLFFVFSLIPTDIHSSTTLSYRFSSIYSVFIFPLSILFTHKLNSQKDLFISKTKYTQIGIKICRREKKFARKNGVLEIPTTILYRR